ncbi:hypothetical protein [Rhizorhabdus histidinilytica]|nr:hypothetical protein [Rhizorhabdus histidinilytica]
MRFHAIDGIRVMDATKGTSGKGFDAALKALEDLETSVAQAREDKPVPPAAEPAPAVEPAPATVITAVPIVEVEEVPAASGAEAEAVPQQQPNPQPTSQDEPAAEPAAVAAPAAAPLPTPIPEPVAVAPAPSRSAMLGRVAIGLGLVSSLVSAAGLVIAERTIMSAQLVVADARERQAQLESATRLIHDLRIVRDRQVELLRAQQAQLASAPVTSAELQHRMENLQKGLLERDPLTQVVRAVHEGQVATNARLNEFERKMDRIETVIGGR